MERFKKLEKGYRVYSLLYGWGKVENPYESHYHPYYDFSVFFENIGIKFYDYYGYEVDGEGVGNMRINKFRDLYWDNPEVIIPEISEKNKFINFTEKIYLSKKTLRDLYFKNVIDFNSREKVVYEFSFRKTDVFSEEITIETDIHEDITYSLKYNETKIIEE